MRTAVPSLYHLSSRYVQKTLPCIGYLWENLFESVHLYDLECDRKINMVLTLIDFEACMKTELA